MTSSTISGLHARQVLDSRGRPTVEAEVHLEGGACARASVPSGASTGKAEAVELRDGGKAWGGLAVARAVANVRGEISELLCGEAVTDQSRIDRLMREADGTSGLSRLGGNAVLAVSLAVARAAALSVGMPLYRYIAGLCGVEPTLPMPMVNILSGGLHAARGMDVQDFLVIPAGADCYTEALEWVCRVRAAAAEICASRGLPTLLADEGGLSPGFDQTESALDLMMASFDAAGLRAGDDVVIALDMASSSLVNRGGGYRFARAGRTYSSEELVDLQAAWVARYPIASIEDGLGEEDWGGWPGLTRRLGSIQLVADDLFATQPARIRRAVESRIANAALIKVNQNGTISGTLEAIRTAREARYATIVSARSGETEDDFLADFAVGVSGGQIKIGSVRNGERQAKYNQLLRIEEEKLPWAGHRGLAPL